MENLTIDTEFITLGQLLKMTNTISSGGMAKWFLDEYIVYVNGEEEQRRGKKLRDGDIVKIPNVGTYKVTELTDGQTDVY
ncbi:MULTISPECIES: S4 domain-containing protein YaaA [Sporosarcina]|uniref:Ribosome-associated protein n=1 Tax=Sporosarcina psychrophila TaxID=1476 RepID=A0ABV2K9C7_SPOPS|nr:MULTISPECIES: S4 domain-containing protein YaaA [Sporosarcina]AMQ04484.1 RNA-binding protein [Sporosarcina psychrophila]QNK88197.1 S4 domain-containing protein YaaA [Sporosarcina sp. resist]